MDRDRIRVTAEAYGIRSRSWVRMIIRGAGIAAVLIGAYNLLLSPFLVSPEILTAYRSVVATVLVSSAPLLTDIVLMVVGAVVAWFI